MATQRQIEANQRNSMRSTGPSESGKLRSRLNSTKHGLAGESAEVEAALSSAFEERRAHSSRSPPGFGLPAADWPRGDGTKLI
jgi:hypothetical protein